LNSAYPGEDLRVPVFVMDFLKDTYAVSFGYEGYGYAVFTQLKELEETGNSYLFQDLRTGETLNVTINKVRMLQNTPRAGLSSGFGGVAMLDLRTL
jgi:hypothetical protein